MEPTKTSTPLRWVPPLLCVVAFGFGVHAYYDHHGRQATTIEPCFEVRAVTARAGMLPSEAVGTLEDARTELARRRAAHERSLAQLQASTATSEAELQPWLQGAISDEQVIIDEIATTSGYLDEAENCFVESPDEQ